MERDFCNDLLIDTNDALLWLDTIDNSIDHNTKRLLKAFSFDYKSLYDSLSPDIVIESLQCAMDEHRTEWTDDFKQWIVNLVDFSLKAAIGQYGTHFYKQKKGVPTGGSLCVQLANITVFYIMRKCVYTDQILMEKISTVKRFIDDGSGFFLGSKRQFSEWINTINGRLVAYGLNPLMPRFFPLRAHISQVQT